VRSERRPVVARKQMLSPPQEGSEAPELVLPAAQGGQFRLGLRTARGPVILAFYKGAWSEECVRYFEALAEKEREINLAGATLAGIGAIEPDEAREFSRASGFRSYVLYDYLREATRNYGLLEKDAEHGDTARPAVFLIGSDYTVLRAWLDERPTPEDLLAEVSRVTGLPKEPGEEGEEESEEKSSKRPRKPAKSTGDASEEGEADAATEASERPTAEGAKKERAGKSGTPEGSETPEKVESGEGSPPSPGSDGSGLSPEAPESKKAGSSGDSGSGGESGEEASTRAEEL
jgi:peroxiredoxin